MNPQPSKRPLLVWGLYAVHVILLISASLYALAALGYVDLGGQVTAQVTQHPAQDTWILLTCVVGCFIAIHYLFVRKPGALPIYLGSVGVYVLPNVARYARACLVDACPGSQFLVNVGFNTAVFGVVVLLIALALRSWPAERRPT